MVRRANKLLISLLIVGITCYLFYFNRGEFTVALGRETAITAPAAIVLLSVFALGVVFSTVFAFFFGLKAYWRRRKLEDRDRRREQGRALMLEARSSLCAEEWAKAEAQWKKIKDKNPDDIIARVELSRSLEGDQKIKEALKVLDEARAYDPTNTEVLFRAAELNLTLGNKTAAVDNLALILYHHENERAAHLARELSEELGRIDDALEYQAIVEKHSRATDEHATVRARLELKKLRKELNGDTDVLRKELKKFIRSHPSFVPATYELAILEKEANKFEDSVKLLLKASKESGDPCYWMEAARIWIKAGAPERAIAAAKAGNDQANGKNRILSELQLIRLYLSLNMSDSAKERIEKFDALLESEKVELDEQIHWNFLTLKARCHNALGDTKETGKILARLSDSDFKIASRTQPTRLAANDSAPPPRLSTP